MLVAISLLKSELEKYPDLSREVSAHSSRIVEHQTYCEYFVQEWQYVFDLLKMNEITFVFTPLEADGH